MCSIYTCNTHVCTIHTYTLVRIGLVYGERMLYYRRGTARRTLHFDAPLSRHHLAWLKASPHQPPFLLFLSNRPLEPSPSRRRSATRHYPLVSQFLFRTGQSVWSNWSTSRVNRVFHYFVVCFVCMLLCSPNEKLQSRQRETCLVNWYFYIDIYLYMYIYHSVFRFHICKYSLVSIIIETTWENLWFKNKKQIEQPWNLDGTLIIVLWYAMITVMFFKLYLLFVTFDIILIIIICYNSLT